MSKLFKAFYALTIGVIAVAATSCSDSDDEPKYDESQPIVGTWIVQEVSNPSYTNYYGGMLGDEEQWKANFINEWTGKKLTFRANQIEDNVVWVEKFDEENPKAGDRSISYEISSSNETELVAYYTETVYNTTNKDRFSRTTAHMVMKRK